MLVVHKRARRRLSADTSDRALERWTSRPGLSVWSMLARHYSEDEKSVKNSTYSVGVRGGTGYPLGVGTRPPAHPHRWGGLEGPKALQTSPEEIFRTYARVSKPSRESYCCKQA